MYSFPLSSCAGKPYIIAVYPSEGWITGGTKVCIVGMNFYEGIEVVFGTLPASCEVQLSSIIIMVLIVTIGTYWQNDNNSNCQECNVVGLNLCMDLLTLVPKPSLQYCDNTLFALGLL